MIKLIDLAKRCGLRASDIDGYIGPNLIRGTEDYRGFSICFTDPSCGVTPEHDKMYELLGMKKNTMRLDGEWYEDLEDAVDRALSLAPRARTL